MFIFRRSWFSKLKKSSLALLGLKTIPAMLKSLSQAAEAGRGVLSFTESLHTAGKDFSKSMQSDEQAEFASSCLAPSCTLGDCKVEKKSSSLVKLDLLGSPSCMEDSSMVSS